MARWFHFTAPARAEATAEAKVEEKAAEEPTPEAGKAGDANSAESELQKEVDELKASLTKATEEAAELKEKWARSLAEMENLRDRTQREMSNARKFAVQGFAKDLLSVSDNLQRATSAVTEDQLAEMPILASFYEGVVMTEKSLHGVFENNGIVIIPALGESFDPNVHEGLFEYEDPERDPGTVGQVIQEGWTLNDRVIRPAKVGTVKAPAPSA